MTPMNLTPATKVTIFWSMVGLLGLLLWAALWVPEPLHKGWLATAAMFVGVNIGFVLVLDLKARGYHLSPQGQRRVRWLLTASWVVLVVGHVVCYGGIVALWAMGARPTTVLAVAKLVIPVVVLMGVLIALLRHPAVTYWGEAH